ncbi:hypothetical protein [Streptomyces sp. Tu6071]|uniref:hypothetical protein n=1 Tax=Streptomyces sp. Tu6071 TaxID=355249 RepID=UPI00131A1C90|nr:hypothetical protein [Streptomyces sp. Tu6071]
MADDPLSARGAFATVAPNGAVVTGWFRDPSGAANPTDGELFAVEAALDQYTRAGSLQPLQLLGHSRRVRELLLRDGQHPGSEPPPTSREFARSLELRVRLRRGELHVLERGQPERYDNSASGLLAWSSLLARLTQLLAMAGQPLHEAAELYSWIAEDPVPPSWATVRNRTRRWLARQGRPVHAQIAPKGPNETTLGSTFAGLAASGTAADSPTASFVSFAEAVLAEALHAYAYQHPHRMTNVLLVPQVPESLAADLGHERLRALWADTLAEWVCHAGVRGNLIGRDDDGSVTASDAMPWVDVADAAQWRFDQVREGLDTLIRNSLDTHELPGRLTVHRQALLWLAQLHSAEAGRLWKLNTTAPEENSDMLSDRRQSPGELAETLLSAGRDLPGPADSDRSAELLGLGERSFAAAVLDDVWGRRTEDALRAPAVLDRWMSELERLHLLHAPSLGPGTPRHPVEYLAPRLVRPQLYGQLTRLRRQWNRQLIAKVRWRHLEARWIISEMRHRSRALTTNVVAAEAAVLGDLRRKYRTELHSIKASLTPHAGPSGLLPSGTPEAGHMLTEARHAALAAVLGVARPVPRTVAAPEVDDIRCADLTLGRELSVLRTPGTPVLAVVDAVAGERYGTFVLMPSKSTAIAGYYRLRLGAANGPDIAWLVALREAVRIFPENADLELAVLDGATRRQIETLIARVRIAAPDGMLPPSAWPVGAQPANDLLDALTGRAVLLDTAPTARRSTKARRLAQFLIEVLTSPEELHSPELLSDPLDVLSELADDRSIGTIGALVHRWESDLRRARTSVTRRALAERADAAAQPRSQPGSVRPHEEERYRTTVAERARSWLAAFHSDEFSDLLAERLAAAGVSPALAYAADGAPETWLPWLVEEGHASAETPEIAALRASDVETLTRAVEDFAAGFAGAGRPPGSSHPLLHPSMLNRTDRTLRRLYAEAAREAGTTQQIGAPRASSPGRRTDLDALRLPRLAERLEGLHLAFTRCRMIRVQLTRQIHRAADEQVTAEHLAQVREELAAQYPERLEQFTAILQATADEAGTVSTKDGIARREVFRGLRGVRTL